jgi:YgiT-type zinc finger domain-containing protein
MTIDYSEIACPACGSKMTVSHEDLQYEECGLPYVVLKNIYTERCSQCDMVLRTIPKITDLHRLLALTLIKKPGPLENFEITFLRKSLGWSKTDFARKLHTQKANPTRWEHPEKPVKMSSSHDLLLRALVAMDNRITSYMDHMEDLNLKQTCPLAHRNIEAKLSDKGWNIEGLAA